MGLVMLLPQEENRGIGAIESGGEILFSGEQTTGSYGTIDGRQRPRNPEGFRFSGAVQPKP
jgi:hypothetical protein